jgi:hypothetical protein
MSEYDFLLRILPIVSPEFYTVKDQEDNEFVFLNSEGKVKNISNRKIDKTQCEAIHNHFHLFNRINFNKKIKAINIGIAISKNLLNALSFNFPQKKFIVFLEVNIKDSTTIRFHQIWNDELPYFNIDQFKNTEVELFEFRTGERKGARH